MSKSIAAEKNRLDALEGTEKIKELLKIYDEAQQGDSFAFCLTACILGEFDVEQAQQILDDVE